MVNNRSCRVQRCLSQSLRFSHIITDVLKWFEFSLHFLWVVECIKEKQKKQTPWPYFVLKYNHQIACDTFQLTFHHYRAIIQGEKGHSLWWLMSSHFNWKKSSKQQVFGGTWLECVHRQWHFNPLGTSAQVTDQDIPLREKVPPPFFHGLYSRWLEFG